MLIANYGEHRQQADVSDVSTPSGVSLPSLPRKGARAELEFDEPEDFANYLADQLIDELIKQIEFDTTSQSPFHLEIWCEKGLPDYIHALARDLGVNVIVEGEGDLSLTISPSGSVSNRSRSRNSRSKRTVSHENRSARANTLERAGRSTIRSSVSGNSGREPVPVNSIRLSRSPRYTSFSYASSCWAVRSSRCVM